MPKRKMVSDMSRTHTEARREFTVCARYLDSSRSSTGKNSMTSSEPTTLCKLRSLGSYANARNASLLAIIKVSSDASGPSKKYKVVLTTRDGFWRYHFGDVVEAVDFDPRDGQPLVVRYVKRWNVHIRIANEVTTETQLRSVLDAMSDLLGGVSEFCVCPDYRESVGRYAFSVELKGILVSSFSQKPRSIELNFSLRGSKRHHSTILAPCLAPK
ncbi:hypothetical protein PISMIDRAFT_278904 [Pisolithus microcarpus 441]|uniref:GH3 middle domain-containing protein n=1 Tax=Pisolithus microcarpus 441 TaxID=765257 RepID=A0A0C9YQJ8_9AGAM|nr:hypothetical protein PISMIDRAFT_278904 [Pisolithus microcarpus 441]